MSKGILLIVSGLSGAGKGTIVSELLTRYPDEFVLSISATTRDPRIGEVNGREYFFVSKAEFESMIEDGKLLEYNCYVNNYYGTPKEWIIRQTQSDRNVILEIEMNGASQVKKLMPDALTIFIMPPSMEELEKRLRGRGTETEEQIEARLERALEEVALKVDYDYVIENVDVDESVEKIHSIVADRISQQTEHR